MHRALFLAGAPALAVLLGGCRNDMHHQAKIKPFRESTFFSDGASARALPEGTVARGFLRDDAALSRGQGPDGKFVEKIPVPLTRELLLRGQERFNIFCSPCHGRTGQGQGMIVQRGFKRPPSYHVDRLRAERAGYFFDVITNGFGQMSSYAMQVTPEDRWAIVAWIRTLQASQHMPGEFLEREDKEHLDVAAAAASLGRGEATAAAHSLEGENAPPAAAHQAPGAAGSPPSPSSPSRNSSSPSSPSKKSSLSSSSSETK